jgi:hypothetical protein
MLSIIKHPLKRPAEKQLDLLYATLDLHGVPYQVTTIDNVPAGSTVITDCFAMENPSGDPGHDIAMDILKADIGKVIFYYPSESYATLSASFEPTANILQERGIEAHLIKCGDWDIPGFTSNNNLPEFFAWIINNEFNRARLPVSYKLIDTMPKTHKFLFFNGEFRQDREYLFKLCSDAGVLDQSIWSHRSGKSATGFGPGDDWVDPFIHPDFRFYAYYPSHYYNTDVSIVSETTQMEFFPTEKIYKSLMLGHPFILYSGKDALAKLRELGFKTFGNVIDESYDTAEYPLARADALIKTITSCPANVIEQTVAERQHNRAQFSVVANSIYGKLIDILCKIDSSVIINNRFDVDNTMLNKYFLK